MRINKIKTYLGRVMLNSQNNVIKNFFIEIIMIIEIE